MKSQPGGWTTLPLEDINTETLSSRLGGGHKADNLVKHYCCEIKRSENRMTDHAECFKKGCFAKDDDNESLYNSKL
jgi:hypothetical protein